MTRSTLRVATVLALLLVSSTAQAILISPGQAVRADYDLSVVTPAPPHQFHLGLWTLGGGGVRSGEQVIFRHFDSADVLLDEFGILRPIRGPISGPFGTTGTGTSDGRGYFVMESVSAMVEVLSFEVEGADFGFTRVTPLVAGQLSLLSVPEPASLALLGIGLAGLGFARKKKGH